MRTKNIVISFLAFISLLIPVRVSAQGLSEWDGVSTAGEYLLSSDITVAGTVTLTGNLTIKLAEGKSNITITKPAANDVDRFHIFEVPAGCILSIQGRDSDNRIIIDGGVSWTDYTGPQEVLKDIQNTYERGIVPSFQNRSPLIRVYSKSSSGGSLNFKYVTIQNCCNSYSTSAQIQASAIYFRGGDKASTFDYVDFKDCQGVGVSGAIFIRANPADPTGSPDFAGEIKLGNCNFTRCMVIPTVDDGFPTSTSGTTGGGAIRTNGPTDCRMVIDNCSFHKNYAYDRGGAIMWNCSGSMTTSSFTPQLAISNCSFVSNFTDGDGGAISNECNMSISACTIDGNKAKKSAGGIYDMNYSKTQAGKPYTAKLEFDSKTVISNNSAEVGGGVVLCLRNTEEGHEPSSVTMDLIINGAKVNGNKANTGGAIVFEKKSNLTNPDKFKGSLIINEGSLLYGNEATDKGGAIYLNGDDISFKINSGIVGLDSSEGKNKAKNGGAIYIDGGNCDIYNGTIEGNTASENGGSFYIAGGNVTMNGGKIAGSNATINGGAFYIDGGDFIMNNGELSSNKSHNLGGGAFIKGGNVNFNNGKLLNNEAVNGGGIFLASGASMTFTDGLLAGNKALAGSLSSPFTTVYNGGNGTGDVIGCGGGIYLQSGKDKDNQTSLAITVEKSFGLYGNSADRAGDDIVAEGVFTRVTVPNVTSMDLKDFEGKDAQPNWYEDYVYLDGSSDSEYAGHSILKNAKGSGKRFKDMLMDGSGDYYNHLVTFNETSRTFPTSAGNDSYVCLSLGYIVLSAIIQTTGLNEKENMYFTLEQLVKSDDAEGWTVKNTYPVLLKGTADNVVQGKVRNLMPGRYRVKQYQIGDNKSWAWAYEVTSPESGVIEKLVTDEVDDHNLFPFTVTHIDGDDNVLHDEEIKVNQFTTNL